MTYGNEQAEDSCRHEEYQDLCGSLVVYLLSLSDAGGHYRQSEDEEEIYIDRAQQ
jgi:hypothetical protein